MIQCMRLHLTIYSLAGIVFLIALLIKAGYSIFSIVGNGIFGAIVSAIVAALSVINASIAYDSMYLLWFSVDNMVDFEGEKKDEGNSDD